MNPELQRSASDKITDWSQKVLLQTNLSKIPAYHTLQFGVDLVGKWYSQPGPPNRWPLQVRADIVWACSGNRTFRTISVVNGTTISGMAEAVNVQVYPFANPQFPGPYVWVPNATDFTASILVGPGVRPTEPNPPTLQSGMIAVVAGGSVDVPIPDGIGVIAAFAHVWAIGNVFNANDSEIAMYNTAMPLFQIDRAWNPVSMPLWVPIYPGDDFLRLYNHDIDAKGQVLYYSISFEIEG
jgi:hypothetical protein